MSLIVLLLVFPAMLAFGGLYGIASFLPKICTIFAFVFWGLVALIAVVLVVGGLISILKLHIGPLACSLCVILRILLLGVVVLGGILGVALLAEGCRSFVEFLSSNDIKSLSIERLFFPWRS